MSDEDDLGLLAERLLASHLCEADIRDSAVPEKIGRYEVVRAIGRGACGRVFLARDPELARTVAVKVLARAGTEDFERFRREMLVLARLEHPGIVRIYDAGDSDDGPFFVMEHLDDPTLAELGPNVEEGVRILEEVARACHAAHERGVVHRDLKPANIVCGRQPVVLDFGVARVLTDTPEAATRVGTPEYMAPEQARGREVGPWTDVHALGAMLYELLTGRTPYGARDAELVLERLKAGSPRRPSEIAHSVPATLEAIAMRALSKQREDRFGSAHAFAEALRDWRVREERWGWLRRHRRALIGAAFIAGIALGVLGTRHHGPPLPPFDDAPPPPPPRRPLFERPAPPPTNEPPPAESPRPPRRDEPPPAESPRPPRRDEPPPPESPRPPRRDEPPPSKSPRPPRRDEPPPPEPPRPPRRDEPPPPEPPRPSRTEQPRPFERPGPPRTDRPPPRPEDRGEMPPPPPPEDDFGEDRPPPPPRRGRPPRPMRGRPGG